MRFLAFIIVFIYALNCTSGSEYDQRNKDFFDEAATLSKVEFSTTALTFDGNIAALTNAINARGDNAEATCAATANCPAASVIEGIVTLPSNYGLALGFNNTGCTSAGGGLDTIFSRSFMLQDANGAILIAYGQEPPSQNTANSSSAKYILNARTPDLAVFGNRLRITVTSVQKYGSGADTIPVVTDFSVSGATVVSKQNSIPYTVKTAASGFTKAADLYQVRQLEGYVTTSPVYQECPSASGTRQFQYNFQTGYMGVLCVGATSVSDASNCTGSKRPFNFVFSLYLGAGTLSGFDTGDMFSYNIATGAKVRMRGPVFTPKFAQTDTNLSLMLGQRLQVETIP